MPVTNATAFGKAAAAAQHGNLCAQLQRQETGGKRQTDDHSNLVDHTGFSFVHCGVNTPAEMNRIPVGIYQGDGVAL